MKCISRLAMTNQHHEHHVEYSTHPMQCLGSNSWENPTHISPGFRLTVSAIARGSDDAEIWTKQWPSFSEYHGGENQTAMDNNNVSWKSCIKYTYITTICIYIYIYILQSWWFMLSLCTLNHFKLSLQAFSRSTKLHQIPNDILGQ